jgi:hypothetical protein
VAAMKEHLKQEGANTFDRDKRAQAVGGDQVSFTIIVGLFYTYSRSLLLTVET